MSKKVSKRPYPKPPAKGLKIAAILSGGWNLTSQLYDQNRLVWLKKLAADLGFTGEDWLFELAWKIGVDVYGGHNRRGPKSPDLSEDFALVLMWSEEKRRGVQSDTAIAKAVLQKPPFKDQMDAVLARCKPNERRELRKKSIDRLRKRYARAAVKFKKIGINLA